MRECVSRIAEQIRAKIMTGDVKPETTERPNGEDLNSVRYSGKAEQATLRALKRGIEKHGIPNEVIIDGESHKGLVCDKSAFEEGAILIKVPEIYFGRSKHVERALNRIEKILAESGIPFRFVGNNGGIFSVKENGIKQLDTTDQEIPLKSFFTCIVFSQPENKRRETLDWLEQMILTMPKGRSTRAAYNAYAKVRDEAYALKDLGCHYEKGVGVCRSSHHGPQNN